MRSSGHGALGANLSRGVNLMDETIETFDTEAEAHAFVSGLEIAQNLIDDDHLTWDAPERDNVGRWGVRVSFVY
jgi:hypothetical protein